MPVRPEDMLRLKLGKLLEFLDMSIDEYYVFIVENELETIEKMAEYLSEDTDICEYCGSNYVFIEDAGMCDDCRDYFLAHKNWR